MTMVKFTIKVNGQEKLLFRIKEVNNSRKNEYKDLNITFPGRKKVFSSFGTENILKDLINATESNEYADFDESHISVHCNPGKDTITIKRTTKFNEKNSISTCQVNPGTKRDQLFVPILFKIVGDIDDPFFNVDNSTDNLVNFQSEYNPKTDQLRFMLIVSNQNIAFKHNIEHPSNILSYQLNNFTITIIYSYFNQPAHKHSINIVPFTTPETFNNIRGLDWWEIYNQYTEINMMYINAYFEKD
jgi:hypothetical protein